MADKEDGQSEDKEDDKGTIQNTYHANTYRISLGTLPVLFQGTFSRQVLFQGGKCWGGVK